MVGRLSGKNALVTGGARGLGAAIAAAFAAEGADVAVLDLKLESARSQAEALSKYGVATIGVSADVSEESDVERAIAEVFGAFGHVDILVNNAGIDTTATVAEMKTAMWDQMMAVNLKGVFLCTRAVLPQMIERKHGRIISIASQLAQKGAPLMAHYCAAKAGVIGFTRSLAYEVAREGITVNAICPGPIDTELFRNLPEEWKKQKIGGLPIGRMAQVEEIAPTAVMLASDDGAYYIGATLNPNGGDVMV